MYNEEETADAGESKDDKENLPETMGWAVQLVWQDLKKCDVQKCSTSNALQYPVGNVLGETAR